MTNARNNLYPERKKGEDVDFDQGVNFDEGNLETEPPTPNLNNDEREVKNNNFSTLINMYSQLLRTINDTNASIRGFGERMTRLERSVANINQNDRELTEQVSNLREGYGDFQQSIRSQLQEIRQMATTSRESTRENSTHLERQEQKLNHHHRFFQHDTTPLLQKRLRGQRLEPERQRRIEEVKDLRDSRTQFTRQKRLLDACKAGDLDAVNAALNDGALAYMDVKGEEPLGAAIWGMNVAVIQRIQQALGELQIRDWSHWERHNLLQYGRIIRITELQQTYTGGRFTKGIENQLVNNMLNVIVPEEEAKDSVYVQQWDKYVSNQKCWFHHRGNISSGSPIPGIVINAALCMREAFDKFVAHVAQMISNGYVNSDENQNQNNQRPSRS